MKIAIAFLEPKPVKVGIRKTPIYFKYLDERLCEKYVVRKSADTGRLSRTDDGAYEVGRDRIVEFLEERRVDFIYMMNSYGKETDERIRRAAFVLKNINFTPLYSKHPGELNFIISKTDWYKLLRIHGKLNNAYVVYNPVDVTNWLSLRKRAKGSYRSRLKGARFIVGRVARAEPSKWSFLIIKTLLELQRRRDYSHGFLFAGMPRLYRATLKLLLNAKMRKNIVFLPELGSPKELAEFYSSIDLFWQASCIGESFGNVIAEAFCFCVPVMTDYKDFFRKSGGVNARLYNAQSELVDHGVNGAYCNTPRNVISFLDGTTKEELRRLGKNGSRKAETEYDIRRTAETMTRIMYDFLRARKGIPAEKRFARLQRRPSAEELGAFESEYLKKLALEKAKNRWGRMERFAYRIQNGLWRIIETSYLVCRKILRAMGMDIEKWAAVEHDATDD